MIRKNGKSEIPIFCSHVRIKWCKISSSSSWAPNCTFCAIRNFFHFSSFLCVCISICPLVWMHVYVYVRMYAHTFASMYKGTCPLGNFFARLCTFARKPLCTFSLQIYSGYELAKRWFFISIFCSLGTYLLLLSFATSFSFYLFKLSLSLSLSVSISQLCLSIYPSPLFLSTLFYLSTVLYLSICISFYLGRWLFQCFYNFISQSLPIFVYFTVSFQPFFALFILVVWPDLANF